MTHNGKLRPWRLWGCTAPLLVLLAGLMLVGDKGDLAAAEKDVKDLPADLARVPQDAFFVLTTRVAELWTSPAFKSVREELAKKFPGSMKEIEETLTREVGVGPADCERLTVIVEDERSGRTLFAVTATKAVEREALVKKLVPGGKEQEYQKQKLVASETKAVHMVND